MIGGLSTMQSYIRSGLSLSKEHRLFFEDLKLYHIEDNKLFVHAGFPGGDIEEQTGTTLTWDRKMWSNALIEHTRNVEKYVTEYAEVYIGHTPTINFICKNHYPEAKSPNQKVGSSITIPMNRCNIWNIDTGAGWNGKLTIMNVDTKEYWQSDLVQGLHPTEKRRHG